MRIGVYCFSGTGNIAWMVGRPAERTGSRKES